MATRPEDLGVNLFEEGRRFGGAVDEDLVAGFDLYGVTYQQFRQFDDTGIIHFLTSL